MCVTSCGLTSEVFLYFPAVGVTVRVFLVVMLYERGFRIEVREKIPPIREKILGNSFVT